MTSNLCSLCTKRLDSGGSNQNPFPSMNAGALSSVPAPTGKLTPEMIQEEIISIQNAIQGFEKQILDCQEQIRLWKSRQNTLCGISRLPDEILIETWAYLADNAGQSVELMMQWLNVSHVCSQWRNIALGTATLWASPCILRPKLASFLLKRAKDASMILHVDVQEITKMGTEMSREAFDLANRLLPRARLLLLMSDETLCKDSNSTEFVSALTRPGNKSLAGLKAITIDYSSTDPVGSGEVDLVELLQNAPALSQTMLFNAKVFRQLSSPMDCLAQITFLEVRANHEYPDGPSSMHLGLHDLLSTLAMLPNLATLTLLRVIKAVDDSDEKVRIASKQPIAMKSLRMLYLATGLVIARAFLDCITHPPDTETVVEFSQNWIWDSTISDRDAFYKLWKTAASQIGRPIRSLDFDLDSENTHYCVSFNAKRTLAKHDHPQFRLFWEKEKPEFLSYIPDMCSSEHLELVAYRLTDSDTKFWKGLGSLPKLTKIGFVKTDEHPALLKVLASFRLSDDSIFEPVGPTGVPQLYFPSLVAPLSTISHSAREYLDRVLRVREIWANQPSQDFVSVEGS